MPGMKGFLLKIAPKRPLYARLIFTVLSFLVLNVLTYIFVRNVIYKNLVRNTENVLLIVQNKVDNYIRYVYMMTAETVLALSI